MKRISDKRRLRNEEAEQPRADLIANVGRCEWCGRQRVRLVVHEILRGSGYRPKALDKPFAQLVLCDGPGDTCHPLMGGRPLAEQLAILMRNRRSDFNLKLFWELAARNYPDLGQVRMWLKRLSFVPATTRTYVKDFS